jgi:uncharacterized phosphosugar-binding protein
MTVPHTFANYVQHVQQQLEQALDKGGPSISEAADWICAAIINRRPLYVFGASHAGLLAQDLFYRAGGLVPIEPIMPAGLMLNERPVQRTSRLERLPGFAQTFMADLHLTADDVVLVISVSGRNLAPVEVCQLAQAEGARVIALTSVAFSADVEPRGSKRLFEVADLTIDLPGVPGDAVVIIDGVSAPVGPTSTAVGSAILHGLMCEVAARIQSSGVEPPVFVSGNLDGSDERNRGLMTYYRDQISYAG